MNGYLKIFRLLDSSERRRVGFLLVCSVLASIIDIVGMSSILPFLSVVADPEIVSRSAVFAYAYKMSGAADPAGFVVALGLAALVVVVVSNVVAFLAQWAQVWYSYDLGRSLSSRIFKSYVGQPYNFFITRNSINLTLNSTDEVEGIVNGTLLPALQILAKVTTTIVLLLLVVLYDPKVAFLFLGVVGGAYLVIFVATRKYVSYFGERGHAARRARFRKTKEALGAIKEIRILGREENYRSEFVALSKIYSRNYALHSIIALAPRYALEAIAVVTMLGFILANAGNAKSLAAIVPTMILYGVAGYRLLPAFQSIFGNMTVIRFNRASLETLLAESLVLGNDQKPRPSKDEDTSVQIALSRGIELVAVTSRYEDATEPSLSGVNIVVPAFETIGIVGASGAGKSTFVDVLTGLLPVEAGEIRVDGVVLNQANMRAWRRSVGYVPQQIYLSDSTVRANIALGVPEGEIDDLCVERAARLASIHDFVTKEMPEKYETIVGENGVRLSGGQRQRLGIARALYRDPSLLIFDEATSALDGMTEDAVIAAIKALAAEKTIIIVAHRLATVQHCNNIYMFERGAVVDEGSYQDLLRRNQVFRQMARVAE